MTAGPDDRLLLRPDCASCAGLCCVALPFARSADFAVDKPAGMPCTHLTGDDRCSIHSDLQARGFRGCTVFDCLGAGQQVTQRTLGGASWRDGPGTARVMFAGFATMRALHELRWYLAEAVARTSDQPQHGTARALADEVRALADGDAATVARTDLGRLQARVGEVLAAVSAALRSADRGADLARQDLAGADLRGRDLRGASLRGALLLGADLRGVDLTRADLLGADLRGADVRGADLADALFVLPPQVAAARGDAATRLPAVVTRPTTWPAAGTIALSSEI